MPVVLSYDDPALVATLASQAGQYARSQDQFDQANRAAQLSSAMTADANQQVLAFNQQFYNQRNTEQDLAIKAMEVAGGGGVYLKQLERWENTADQITLVAFEDYPVPARWRLVFDERAPVQTPFREAGWIVPGP